MRVERTGRKKSIMPVGKSKAYGVMPVLLLQVVRNASKTSDKYLTFPDRSSKCLADPSEEISIR